jgi:cell volume regulation protein A
MDFLNVPLLAAAALLFLSVLAGLFSSRIGFSFLLVFLVAGGLAGEDGPGGFSFSDFTLSFWVGNVALAVILLDGGLRTRIATFRTGLRPSLLLATLGVVISAGLTGLAAIWFLDLDWQHGLLLGAIIGSTDAAAVFSLLRTSGVTLNERVSATLEIESGMNDPMAVYLTLAMISVITGAGSAGDSVWGVLRSFLQQFCWGAAIGLAGGCVLAWLLRRSTREDSAAGIMALLVLSAGLVVFAAAGLVGGSGFLAIYLFGLVVGNRGGDKAQGAMFAMDGYAWLSQAGMFLLLGLLVTPSAVLTTAWPALGIACVLMFLARPVAVWLCLIPCRFQVHETWFISWVGLRGAVPIVLAVFPLMAGVPRAMELFNVAFVVVLVSLLLQGTTIALAGRYFRVTLPERADERHSRAVFGDFTLDADAPVDSVCAFYGLPDGEQVRGSLADWMAASLKRPPVVGDSLRLGRATLSVRAMKGPRILAVGLKLDDQA